MKSLLLEKSHRNCNTISGQHDGVCITFTVFSHKLTDVQTEMLPQTETRSSLSFCSLACRHHGSSAVHHSYYEQDSGLHPSKPQVTTLFTVTEMLPAHHLTPH